MSGQPIVQRAVVTLAGTDDQQYPVQQVTYQGKVADAEVVFPYGMHANLLTEDTLCLLFSINNEEDYRAVMGYTPNLRPKNLEEGEVVFYHPVTGSQIFFRNNGDIDILVADGSEDETGGNANITITRDFNIVVGGVAVLTASSIELDANTTITGSNTITEDFGCNGAAAQSAASLGIEATNLATVITLANSIRTALIANGIGQ